MDSKKSKKLSIFANESWAKAATADELREVTQFLREHPEFNDKEFSKLLNPKR